MTPDLLIDVFIATLVVVPLIGCAVLKCRMRDAVRDARQQHPLTD